MSIVRDNLKSRVFEYWLVPNIAAERRANNRYKITRNKSWLI